tara:strand:+ start:1281 stop:1694 length:414 start_codon:yes stop_codon:yes gene_type:complete
MREILSIFIFIVITVLFLYHKFSGNQIKKEPESKAFCGNVFTSESRALKSEPHIAKAKCAACHLYNRDATGPNMKYLSLRQPYEGWFQDFITNQDSLVTAKDPYTLAMMEYSPVEFRHNFQELDTTQVKELYEYYVE